MAGTPVITLNTSGGKEETLPAVESTKVEILSFDTLPPSLQDFIRLQGSTGLVEGGLISTDSDPVPTYLADVESIEGWVRSGDTDIASLVHFNLGPVAGITINDQEALHFFVDYNAGSPTVVTQTSFARAGYGHTCFYLGNVVRDGTLVRILNNPDKIANATENTNKRLADEGWLITKGMVIAGTGVRNLLRSAGTVWNKSNEFKFTEFNSALTNTFDVYVGPVLDAAGETQIDNTSYDNSGTKTALGANRYGMRWVYQCGAADGCIVVLYGSSNAANSLDALSEVEPGNLPLRTETQGFFVGKCLVQEGSDTIVYYPKAELTQTPGAAVEHNELPGLTGGVDGERNHLDDADYTALTDQAAELATTGSPNWVKAGFNQPTPVATVDAISTTSDGTSDGLLVSNPAGPVVKVSGDKTTTFYGTPRTYGVLEAGEGLQPLTSALYVQSRLQNLVTNGNGLLGNNYNFTSFTFDAAELHGGGGSFLESNDDVGSYGNEYIPVDPEKKHIFTIWGKSGDVGGGNYDAAKNQLAGIALYDIDKNVISPQHSTKYPGSTDTTLAVALNINDTTMTVSDATGWYSGTNGLTRTLARYNYSNSFGYVYPDYTYTRNIHTNLWPEGGITGNVITLNEPWAGPDLPAGTAIRNAIYGSTSKYFVYATNVPQVWTKYENYIKKETGDGVDRLNDFRAGTAFARLYFLLNRYGTVQNNIRWSDVSFSSISSDSIEPASATLQGVVSLEDQVLGDGKKTFQSDVDINGALVLGDDDHLTITTPIAHVGDTVFEFKNDPLLPERSSVFTFKEEDGDNILRCIGSWPNSFSDSEVAAYFQVGIISGNGVFSSAQGTGFNRLYFVVGSSPGKGFLITDSTSGSLPPDGYVGIRKGGLTDFLDTEDGNIVIGGITASARLHIRGRASISLILQVDDSNDNIRLTLSETGELYTSGPRVVDADAAITGDHTVTNSDKEIIYGNPTGSDKNWTLPTSPTENGKRTYVNASDTYSMILNGGEKKVAGSLNLYTIGPGLAETFHYTTAFGHTRI